MITLEAESITYWSRHDEDAFFEWLGRIGGVQRFYGRGRILFIETADEVGDDDLRELIALFQRYQIDMRQLSALLTPANAAWFKKPGMYWYDAVWLNASV